MVLLNTSLPLIFGEWIILSLSLIFIVLFEAWIYNAFRKNFKKAFIEVGLANVFSNE
jgi:hypothetical protein